MSERRIVGEEMTAAEFVASQGKKANKYHAERVEDDGYLFSSKAEHRRYKQLTWLVASGDIAELVVHPESYKLVVNGVLITKYRPDFAYVNRSTLELVVEDVKSAATAKARDWPLRKKLMLALYGIRVHEVTA